MIERQAGDDPVTLQNILHDKLMAQNTESYQSTLHYANILPYYIFFSFPRCFFASFDTCFIFISSLVSVWSLLCLLFYTVCVCFFSLLFIHIQSRALLWHRTIYPPGRENTITHWCARGPQKVNCYTCNTRGRRYTRSAALSASFCTTLLLSSALVFVHTCF